MSRRYKLPVGKEPQSVACCHNQGHGQGGILPCNAHQGHHGGSQDHGEEPQKGAGAAGIFPLAGQSQGETGGSHDGEGHDGDKEDRQYEEKRSLQVEAQAQQQGA